MKNLTLFLVIATLGLQLRGTESVQYSFSPVGSGYQESNFSPKTSLHQTSISHIVEEGWIVGVVENKNFSGHTNNHWCTDTAHVQIAQLVNISRWIHPYHINKLIKEGETSLGSHLKITSPFWSFFGIASYGTILKMDYGKVIEINPQHDSFTFLIKGIAILVFCFGALFFFVGLDQGVPGFWLAGVIIMIIITIISFALAGNSLKVVLIPAGITLLIGWFSSRRNIYNTKIV